MSIMGDDASAGNSEKDWEIFEVLCPDVSMPTKLN